MFKLILFLVLILFFLVDLNIYLQRRFAYLFKLKSAKYLYLFFSIFTILFIFSMELFRF